MAGGVKAIVNIKTTSGEVLDSLWALVHACKIKRILSHGRQLLCKFIAPKQLTYEKSSAPAGLVRDTNVWLPFNHSGTPTWRTSPHVKRLYCNSCWKRLLKITFSCCTEICLSQKQNLTPKDFLSHRSLFEVYLKNCKCLKTKTADQLAPSVT